MINLKKAAMVTMTVLCVGGLLGCGKNSDKNISSDNPVIEKQQKLLLKSLKIKIIPIMTALTALLKNTKVLMLYQHLLQLMIYKGIGLILILILLITADFQSLPL